MISILIPIYNGIEFIEESVSSVLNQTYDKWELLIGINGHPENSDVYNIAKEYEKKSDKIRVFDFYTIKGKSNTLNQLLHFSKYNYIALLDVDDIWHNQKLAIQAHLLNYFDVIGSNCVYFGDITNTLPYIPIGDISNFNFTKINPFINSSCIIRKKLCYWNSKWDGIEDYDIWLRLKKQKKKFYNCKQILLKHRIHNDSAFNSKKNGLKVDNLLISHGYKSRKEIQQNSSKNNYKKLIMI
jgi:glycosyltransferase involved in cell wall biosynthesis